MQYLAEDYTIKTFSIHGQQTSLGLEFGRLSCPKCLTGYKNSQLKWILTQTHPTTMHVYVSSNSKLPIPSGED